MKKKTSTQATRKPAPKASASPKKAVTPKHVRPSWDEYFMSIADMVGTRATCDRGRSGCVITKDKRILVTGYVGSPIGQPHCDEAGHEMHTVTHEDGSQSMHCIRTIHAEQNAVAQAARMGIPLDGATVYCRMTPCYVCAKILINAGIKRVVANKDYHASKQSKVTLKRSKIELVILHPEVEAYSNARLK